MILKSLHLGNIRSYIDEKVIFPDGSIMLSGDIGSGKSSILLAVEFALFGIKRGEFSGSSLLRNGEKEGFVELNLEIEGKNIVVKRTLKRGNDSIKQEAGYIVINDKKFELTPVELKYKVFELLGYPVNLVSKSKDSIFRFTVYTPQEEMKHILMESADIRLDTLRRIFHIDRYKKIKENCVLYVREIKSKMREYAMYVSDIEEKKKEVAEKGEEVEKLKKEITPKKEELEKLNFEVKKSEEALLKKEDEGKNFMECKKELEILENKRSEKIKLIQMFNSKLQSTTLPENIKEKKKLIESLLDSVSDKDEVMGKIDKFESEKENLLGKGHECKVNIRNNEETKNKISSLDTCPVCLQEVDDNHKKSILDKSNKIISENKEDEEKVQKKLVEMKNELDTLKKNLESMRENEKKIILIRKEIESFEEKKKEIDVMEKEIKNGKIEVGEINRKKIELNSKLNGFENFESEFNFLKEKNTSLKNEEKNKEIEIVSLEKEREGIEKLIVSINEDVEKREKIRKKITKIGNYQNWLEENFSKIVSLIEKNVMIKIYREFNELFQRWFDSLIEDENLTARLDENFTPVVTQSGYDIDFADLSGGERQSVALAYRLALNKVLNELIQDIKTKDIIILDEPTDGFSSEQLDRIRDVLEELTIKQVIIVSHEAKIESFVDNVVRIEKRESVSRIIS